MLPTCGRCRSCLITRDCFCTAESMKKQTSSSRSPRNPEKKKFTADMISAPQNDLRHTGHIGYDGINFGDIPVGPEKVEKIIPIKGGSSGGNQLFSSGILSFKLHIAIRQRKDYLGRFC